MGFFLTILKIFLEQAIARSKLLIAWEHVKTHWPMSYRVCKTFLNIHTPGAHHMIPVSVVFYVCRHTDCNIHHCRLRRIRALPYFPTSTCICVYRFITLSLDQPTLSTVLSLSIWHNWHQVGSNDATLFGWSVFLSHTQICLLLFNWEYGPTNHYYCYRLPNTASLPNCK